MPLDLDDRKWLDERFKEISELFHGPKGEPQKGINIRMDRLERIVTVIIFVAGAAASAAISALAKSYGNGSSPPPSHP